jgi:YidC/Oxa1 family membrane protein insertase
VPEIQNPNLPSSSSGGQGNLFPLLAVILPALLLFFGYQHAHPYAHPAAVVLQTATPGSFGWLSFIAQPLYTALRFLHEHGIANWGWDIVIFTVIFNLLVFWPRWMAMKSSLKVMRIQPKVNDLKQRYEHLKINDPKRAEMNTEMMALYQAEGVKIYGSCLPMLIPMPLFFATLSVLRNAFELHQAHWLWLSDLSAPDPLHILPLLIIGSMSLTQWITPAGGMSTVQRRLFALLMPAVVGFSLWHYAAGLSLYWVTGNLTNLLMQVAINRSKMGKEMQALAAQKGA